MTDIPSCSITAYKCLYCVNGSFHAKIEDMEKLFCYIDESGQDTEGAYFIVVVVIMGQGAVNALEATLEKIEYDTGKQKRKWRGTRLKERMAYLTRILHLPELEQSVFYMSFHDTTDYTHLTATTIAHAIAAKATGAYQAYITIDGLQEKEREQISKTLHQRGIKRRKLRGGKEESSALLRLVDIMAGFIRDYEEGKSYVQELYHHFSNQRIITKLSA